MKPEDRLDEAYKQLTIVALLDEEDDEITENQRRAAENLAGLVDNLARSVEAVRELDLTDEQKRLVTDNGRQIEDYSTGEGEGEGGPASALALRSLVARVDKLENRVDKRETVATDIMARLHDLEVRVEQLEAEILDEVEEVEGS